MIQVEFVCVPYERAYLEKIYFKDDVKEDPGLSKEFTNQRAPTDATWEKEQIDSDGRLKAISQIWMMLPRTPPASNHHLPALLSEMTCTTRAQSDERWMCPCSVRRHGSATNNTRWSVVLGIQFTVKHYDTIRTTKTSCSRTPKSQTSSEKTRWSWREQSTWDTCARRFVWCTACRKKEALPVPTMRV